MKIAIGADHRGFAYKELIRQTIQEINGKLVQWIDKGAYNNERSDYPVYARDVCLEIINNRAENGVLICGTGGGMAVAANRFSGIYAVVAWNIEIARLARSDDNANILVIPSDFVSSQIAIDMILIWGKTSFLGGRYQQRIDLINQLPD